MGQGRLTAQDRVRRIHKAASEAGRGSYVLLLHQVEDLIADEMANLEAEVKDRCAKILESAELGQTAFEGNADVVILNGELIGGTIPDHSLNLARWWPAVQEKLAALMRSDHQAP